MSKIESQKVNTISARKEEKALKAWDLVTNMSANEGIDKIEKFLEEFAYDAPENKKK